MDTSAYPDSVDSSPRSRGGESWDEPFPSSAAAAAAPRLRLMCSYGGRIVPRPTDKSLCYLGGETRIVVVDRQASLADLHAKLSRSLLNGLPFSLKYQLPNEDLDSLISVSTDEDLDNMIDEYDRIVSSTSSGSGGGSTRTSRLRLFLFPSKPESTTSSVGSLMDDSSKSDTWFVDALNSAMGALDGFPRNDSASVNCLLGLEDDSSTHSRGGGGAPVVRAAVGAPAEQLPRPDSSGKLARQDVHSVPDSPMLDTSSSFGSASSAPSLSNLPPIRVRADDRPPDSRIGDLNDQFAHMGISAPSQRQDEGLREAALLHHQPPVHLPASSATNPTISHAENPNRVFSDDEKSDHGGVRRMPQPPPQQHKPSVFDLPISDPNARPMYYQERTSSSELKYSDAGGYRAPMPVADAGQIQQQHQIHHHQQSQPPPPQQFIQTNPHYIHHPATGTFIPVPSYYPMPQQSQQSHSHVPMYYLPVHQNPSPQYNLASMQPNLADPTAGKSTVPMVALKPQELPTSSLYRTAAAAAAPPAAMHPSSGSAPAQLIHVSTTDQAHQFAGMGYHLMHHQPPSQPPATMVNYAYDFADPANAPQMYYSQATSPPAMAPQYQTMSAAAVAAIPDATGEAKQTRGS
ncbi:uncharacterized protein [Typha angustifolia]|uniref:uncharacterized protein n=1 Tax=Typha angustifolia TaxID=59011 RepID=UPI003C2C11E7